MLLKQELHQVFEMYSTVALGEFRGKVGAGWLEKAMCGLIAEVSHSECVIILNLMLESRVAVEMQLFR